MVEIRAPDSDAKTRLWTGVYGWRHFQIRRKEPNVVGIERKTALNLKKGREEAAPRHDRNISNVKSVGSGVFECRIDFGPGYRVYFGKDGEHLVILLGGGMKKRQQEDIHTAIARWQDFKRRK